MDKIILFELNEVPIRIIEYYCKMRPNSWLAKHFDQLKKFETYCENGGHISPWNTWPTLHRGVTNQKHFISDFNQDLKEVDAEFPPLWKILADTKVKTGVFGSLHSYPPPVTQGNYSFYVPDVFAVGKECFPKDIEIFQDINLKLSRKSARNVDSSIPYKDMLRLFGKAGSLGFKANTLVAIGGQLVQEKTTPWKTVRRRTYQTVLSFDVFYKLLVKEKPDFTTFFTNHVASSQHRYWAAVFPTEYKELKYDQEWIETYENEIIFTMSKTDEMLKRLAHFVDRNPAYKLMITSSMGQEAVESEPIETQLYIENHEAFFANFGIAKDDFIFLPSMLPQFNYFVKDGEGFAAQLETMRVNDKKVHFRDLGEGRFSIDLGQQNLTSTEVILNGKVLLLDQTGLKNVVIEDKSSATAYHIPEGHCFIYHPSFKKSAISSHQVSTQEIMPTILQNFAVHIPSYAAHPSQTILT
jgi:hypothetical protein